MPMTDPFKERLLPILKEEKVAREVVLAIRRNRSQLFLPPLVHIVPVLRFLPPLVFDSIANILGINASMDEFVGRTSHTTPAQEHPSPHAG